MNASTRRCSEHTPCHLMHCLPCRHRLIDATARQLLTSGMPQDEVERYRSGAQAALALEIQPAAPKPKPRKAFTPKPDVDYDAIMAMLRRTDDRAGATVLLGALTIPEIRYVAGLMGYPLVGRVKAEMVSSLTYHTVQYRLDTQAILNAR